MLPEGSTLEDAKKVCAKLKERNIEARPFWKPVHLQKPYADCPVSDLSVSEGVWQRIITLPCSTGITDEELAEVVVALGNII